MISVVIPAYNEEQMILKAAQVIDDILSQEKIPNELIFIDDGSKDKTWEKIVSLSGDFDNIRGVRFSRNFGKEAAIMAGLSASNGECCVVIDCDLQHPPEKIVEMYRLWEQGFEIVEGQKSTRGKEGKVHSLAAKLFYRLISAATHLDMTNASDFKLLDRKVVNALVNMREKNAFFRALSSWVGFKSSIVKFEVRERETGESKWSMISLIKYAVSNVTSFSTLPMQIVTILGLVMFLVSLVIGVNSLIQKICGHALEGFTTVILLTLFSSSVIMMSLGIMGYYISKIYEEIKDRPKYIVSETCGEKR